MLPDHIIRQLHYIELCASKRIRSQKVGTYTSPMRGSGFDFDEHRLYRQGDDVRRIDWNVTARMNAPYLRETHAERELNVVVALDMTRSMSFGTGEFSKKERMLFIAACLVFSAVADQVNVGFMAFSDRPMTYQRPVRARARAWNMLEEIYEIEPSPGETKILPAARFLSDQLKALSIVFFVSDFMTDEDLDAAKDLKALAVRHDVIAVVVQDPVEVALPAGSGAVTLRDLESGVRTRVGLSKDLRMDYAEAVQARRRALVDMFYRTQMDHVFLPTDKDVVQPLLRLFASRRHA